MDIVREIDIFIKKHVTTSESFSPLYLAAWCLASWLPVPHIPPLFIRGSGTLKLVTVLTYLSGEIVVRDKFKGLTVTPTLLMEEPDWTGGCFLIGAEETGIEPAFDKGLRLRIGTWVRENGPVVQDVYWQLLNGAPPDALAPMTAVLLVSAGNEGGEGADGKTNASSDSSSYHGVSQQLGDSVKLEKITPTAWERRNHV